MSTEINWTLAANIKRLREAAGITQREAALACDVTENTWGNWENGKTDVPTSRLPAIAVAVKATEPELLSPTNEQLSA